MIKKKIINKKYKNNNKITLKDFLKRYTMISSKFIDEYYSFYEMCEKNTFGILIDNVIKYLDIKNNDRFYENFKKKYIENVDYIIKQLK